MRLQFSAPVLLVLAVVLPTRNAVAAPSDAEEMPVSAKQHEPPIGLSSVALEPFFAQQLSSSGNAELLGVAVRLDTATPDRPSGWYLRVEGMDRVPLHGATGDLALHSEGGLLHRRRLGDGPLAVGVSLSAGFALGGVHERQRWIDTGVTRQRIPAITRFSIGAGAAVSLDLHVYFVTLSFQTRWRTTLRSSGQIDRTSFLGPGLGAEW